MGAKVIRTTSTNIVASSASRSAAAHFAKPEPPLVMILWRNRRIISTTVAVTLGLGLLYFVFAHRTYKSTASVLLDPGRHHVIGDNTTETEQADTYYATQCQVMTSAPVAAIALGQDGMSNLQCLNGIADPVEYLEKHVTAETGKKDNIIAVSFEARNPIEAATVVNGIVKAYVDFQTKSQSNNEGALLVLLQKEKSRDEAAIAAKNAELANLRETFGEASYDSNQSNPIMQQESDLSRALSAARLDAVNSKAGYDQALALVSSDPLTLAAVNEPDTAGDLVAASTTQLEAIKTEMIRLSETLKDLKRHYLPDHPTVLQAQSRLAQITITYVRAVREHWLSAKAQQEALQDSFNQQHKSVLEQGTRAADIDSVKTDVARIGKDLDVVEERISRVSADQDAGALSINVLDPAKPATSPSHPSKASILLASLVSGLLIGSGLALVKDKTSLAPRQVEELSTELGVTVLGLMPRMDASGTLASRALQVHLDPVGSVAEAARSMVHSLERAGFNDQSGRTLLVTSANQQEGRTTIATSLAIAMAQAGLRVLVVDANSNAPRLHTIFSANNTYGLFDVLSGQVGDQPAINTTPVEGLDLLPCGMPPANAIDRLNSEALVDLLGELSDRYDRVIIDSPALGRGVETRILAANCAAAVLVSTARPTTRRQMENGLRQLQSVGANVLGVIINEPGSISPFKAITGDELRKGKALSSDRPRVFQPIA